MSDAGQKLCRIWGRSFVVKATLPYAVRGVCVILNCCLGKIMFTLRAVQQRSAACFEGLLIMLLSLSFVSTVLRIIKVEAR